MCSDNKRLSKTTQYCFHALGIQRGSPYWFQWVVHPAQAQKVFNSCTTVLLECVTSVIHSAMYENKTSTSDFLEILERLHFQTKTFTKWFIMNLVSGHSRPHSHFRGKYFCTAVYQLQYKTRGHKDRLGWCGIWTTNPSVIGQPTIPSEPLIFLTMSHRNHLIQFVRSPRKAFGRGEESKPGRWTKCLSFNADIG